MRMYTKSGRSRWPLVIGAAVVVIAVGGGIAYTSTRQEVAPAAAPTSAAPTSTPTTTATAPSDGGTSGAGDGNAGAPPTGCLGGQDRDAAMVLAAQTAAPHSAYGAVEAATAFYRFLWQYPYPSSRDIASVSSSVIASTASKSWKDIAGSYAAAGNNPTQGTITAGVSFHVSTTNGLWRVSEDSTSDRVTVEVAVGYVVDGALSSTKVAGIGLVMVWENNAWHVESGTVIDQAKLAAGGNRFTAGC